MTERAPESVVEAIAHLRENVVLQDVINPEVPAGPWEPVEGKSDE